MAKKTPAKKTRTINQQLTLLQRTVQAGIRRTDVRFNRIDSKTQGIDARFNRIDSKFQAIDVRFNRIDSKFQAIDVRFNRVDSKFQGIDARIRQMDAKFGLEFREVRKEMNERFSSVEDRIDRLATHVDGFMKLHETLDIEMRVMKEQMNRFEERLKRIEVAQAS